MADLTFKANLLPNSDLGKALGSENQRWNIYGELNGNASSADKLKTTRTLTIGETGKDFDGSANVSWSHAEIGATVSNTWTAGTTAGPTITTTVNGVAGTPVAIPSASASASGIVTTGTQTFAGLKTFKNDNGAIMISKNGVTRGTIPSANSYSGLYLLDSTGQHAHSGGGRMAIVEAYYATNGITGLQLCTYPNTAGSTATNYIGIYSTQDGTATYSVRDPAAFRAAIGTDSVYVKKAGDTMTGTLILSKTTDASGTADNKPALIVGGVSTGAHIEIDNNEILAKSNGTTPTTLYLQDTTGTVNVSGSGGLQVFNGSLDAASHIIVSTKTAGNAYNQSGSAIQIREVNRVGTAQTAWTYAPKIGFHWSGKVACQLGMDSGQNLRLYNNSSTTGGTFIAGKVYGAVWNDYAEMRNIPEAQKNLKTVVLVEEEEIIKDNTEEIPMAGRCVYEIGDDTMTLTTHRLQKGCKIISDTFGFNIGETENAHTPVAVSGRVLAYLLEDREIAKEHIGDFVCSGPNGTVSIMTTEEYFKYPQTVVGTISAVPDYEEWGTGHVKVDGRIWIYVR